MPSGIDGGFAAGGNQAMKNVRRQIRNLVGVALGLALFPGPAPAQVKQWTDEKGVTHFEAHDTGKTPSPRADQNNSKATPGKTSVRIERTHAGLTLGDNDSSYRNSPQWRSGAIDKFGGQIFSGKGSLGAMFVDDRLAMIRVTYVEYELGGWDTNLKVTADKYGPPKTNGYSEAIWLDGPTLLSFTKNYRGGVEVMISDTETMTRYTTRSGQAAPKF
jgi:hypothetical protein